jgi:hypothetical protein
MFIVSALLGLIFPDQYVSPMDVDASVGGRVWGRAFGAVSLGLGAMLWMMGPSGDQRAMRIGGIAAALAFGLTGIGDAVSVIAGHLPAYGWGFVAFHAVMGGLTLYDLLTPAGSADVHA